MKNIYFNNYSTTNLGFGCSLLTRNNSIKDAILNLEVAYDNGIRHFDIARVYGFGEAETILGKFAKTKRDQITITSKTGLRGRRLPLWSLPFINTIRKSVQSNTNASITNRVTGLTAKGIFSPKLIEKDLHASLKKLNCEYIDFYLLHEATISQANNEDIVAALNLYKNIGKIRAYGIASSSNSIKNEYENLHKSYEVLQHSDQAFGNNILLMPINNELRLRIIYNIFSRLEEIKQLINESKINNNINPIQYILSYYKKYNKNGITLFASTNNSHIKNTVQLWNTIEQAQFDEFNRISNNLIN